ncbi:MAG TPA: hypothetical protein VIT45_02955 [Allosphingosinicella sp.]
MASPDPDPPLPDQSALAWKRYRNMMKWMVLASVIAVILALIFLGAGGEPMSIHLIVATTAGVGLSVLLGTALMGLVFLSNRSGADDEAAGGGGGTE